VDDQASDAVRTLRGEIAERLHAEVKGMSLDNFLVRPQRRLVERFAKATNWKNLSLDDRLELTEDVAGLPSSLVDDDTAAKEFDLLMLKTELAILRADRRFTRLKERVVKTCGLLEELANIPAVSAELALIHEMQTDEYWQDVTAPMLESARKRLRDLVKLIELKKRALIFTDFEDEIGLGSEIAVHGLPAGTDMDSFRRKARHFLKEHENHIAIQKLRRNEPLTPTDLRELERMFVEAGIASEQELAQVRLDGGVGLFVRSLVGLDREAAKHAFADFLADKTLGANQIEFLNMVINHLTERGAMEPKLLYESPFTDFNPSGIAGLFDDRQVTKVIHILDDVNRRAAA
jgi:type I restriction enzyme R subunit